MSGTTTNITFEQIPANLRIHGTFVEIDPGANTAQAAQRTLIIGQITAAGVATPNHPLVCAGSADAVLQGGPNSMLSLMAQQYLSSDPLGIVYYLPLADDPVAVKASGTITVAGTATAAGVLSWYIAGTLVPVQTTVGMTATQMATAMVAAVAETPNLPVTAASAAGVVTLTAVNGGLAGNDIDVRYNYYGTAASEVAPAGFTFTGMTPTFGTQLTGGAQNPTALATALANLSDMTFDFVVFPYTDAASLNAWQTFMNNTSGRWSYTQQLYGGAFGALRGTLGSATTALLARNDPAIAIMPFNDAPQPSWIWAAEIAAECAISLRANPAIPLQEIVLNLLPPPVGKRFMPSDRETLLYSGGSTFVVNDAGQVITDRMITTYQQNTAGQPDDSYLDVETRYQLMFCARDLITYLSSKYSRKIFVDDGTRLSGSVNNAVVMPAMIKASVINRYNYTCSLGITQDPTDFANQVAVQKVGSAAKVFWPGDLANQLRQMEILVSFSKT